MTPGIRKIALTAHITSSVGWLGAVAGFEALAIAGLMSQNTQTMRAAYLAMKPIAWFVIVPFAFASLLTGLVMSLGTKWGLFRHYWILVKFLINILAIGLLLLHTQLISYLATAAGKTASFSQDLRGLRIQLVAVAGAALLALLAATTLAVFKPQGLTPLGRRKQEQERFEIRGGTPVPTLRGAPAKETTGTGRRLGLKIFFGIMAVIIVVLVALHLAGGGLGRHHH